MHAISNLRLTDSRPSFSPGRDAATADSASSFPGLPEVIGLVEQALQLRRTEAMNAHLAQFLPPLMKRLRAHLPQQLLQPDPLGYRRFDLHHCPIHGYQILAMVWGPGQGTPVHDHAEQWGIEAVMLGELQTVRYAPIETAGTAVRLRATEVIDLGSGGVEFIDPAHGLHLCRNPSMRAVTVTLHVYARPLDVFGVYEDQGDGWHLRREHTPRIESL